MSGVGRGEHLEVDRRREATGRVTKVADLREQEGMLIWTSWDKYGGVKLLIDGFDCVEEDLVIKAVIDWKPVAFI